MFVSYSLLADLNHPPSTLVRFYIPATVSTMPCTKESTKNDELIHFSKHYFIFYCFFIYSYVYTFLLNFLQSMKITLLQDCHLKNKHESANRLNVMVSNIKFKVNK
jgi:hypothetical protein